MSGKILVSACLLGQAVRYDGAANPLRHPTLARWQEEGRIVPICPEVTAGFAIPRPPAEIAGDAMGADAMGTDFTGHADGADVLDGRAPVREIGGTDVTALFVAGAKAALALARENDCRFALLIDGSPSCGSGFIYDGSFSGRRRPGAGVTATLLRRNGIEVYAPAAIDTLDVRLSALQR